MSNKRIRNPKLKPWLRGWDWTELTNVYGVKDRDTLFPELQWKEGDPETEEALFAHERAVAKWLKDKMRETWNGVMQEHWGKQKDVNAYNKAALEAWKIRHFVRLLGKSKYDCCSTIWAGVAKVEGDETLLQWMITFLENAWD